METAEDGPLTGWILGFKALTKKERKKKIKTISVEFTQHVIRFPTTTKTTYERFQRPLWDRWEAAKKQANNLNHRS